MSGKLFLVWIMAWCWTGNKPSSKPMLTCFIYAALGEDGLIIPWYADCSDSCYISSLYLSILYMQILFRADSKFAPSQWEAALLCNTVSHWHGASLESALHLLQVATRSPTDTIKSSTNNLSPGYVVSQNTCPSTKWKDPTYYFLQEKKSYW